MMSSMRASATGQESSTVEVRSTDDATGDKAQHKVRISCIAVVAPNNAPLYMRTFDVSPLPTLHSRKDGAPLQMQEVIYNSLDVIEERLSSLKSRQMRENDGFLGCLAVVGKNSLYGNVSNSAHKIILAIKGGGDTAELDASVRAAFRRIKRALVVYFMNPMVPLGGPIRSKNFEKEIEEVVRWFA